MIKLVLVQVNSTGPICSASVGVTYRDKSLTESATGVNVFLAIFNAVARLLPNTKLLLGRFDFNLTGDGLGSSTKGFVIVSIGDTSFTGSGDNLDPYYAFGEAVIYAIDECLSRKTRLDD